MAKSSGAKLSDGRIVPNHFTDYAAMAAALGGVQPPPPQFPGAVPAPNPDPNAVPVPQQTAAPAHRTVPRRTVKKAKKHKK